jgi:hypothetical protein
MAIWLQGWNGDNAGSIVGRLPNQLLVALTITDGTVPSGLFARGDLNGVPWYFDMEVSCLTPGTRHAGAIDVKEVGDYVWSVQLAEVDFGDGRAPWTPGIQLFSLRLWVNGGNESGTIASATIDGSVTRIDATHIRPGFPQFWRTGARATPWRLSK